MKKILLIGLITFGIVAFIFAKTSNTKSVDNDNQQASQTIPEELQNILLQTPQKVSEFHLLDQHQQPFTLQQLKGKWSFIVFGYTNCPDVCPTTLVEMDDLSQLLAPIAAAPKNTQYIFVTLDPKRDTAKELAVYLNYFNSSFIGVTGEVDKIRQFTAPLDINFSYQEYAPGEYAVNHSSSVVLIDPQGQYVARFAAPQYANVLSPLFLKISKFLH